MYAIEEFVRTLPPPDNVRPHKWRQFLRRLYEKKQGDMVTAKLVATELRIDEETASKYLNYLYAKGYVSSGPQRGKAFLVKPLEARIPTETLKDAIRESKMDIDQWPIGSYLHVRTRSTR